MLLSKSGTEDNSVSLKSGSKSSSFGSFDSMASRINFWKDINTKDEEYSNAVILSMNQGLDLERKRERMMRLEESRGSSNRKVSN